MDPVVQWPRKNHLVGGEFLVQMAFPTHQIIGSPEWLSLTKFGRVALLLESPWSVEQCWRGCFLLLWQARQSFAAGQRSVTGGQGSLDESRGVHFWLQILAADVGKWVPLSPSSWLAA